MVVRQHLPQSRFHVSLINFFYDVSSIKVFSSLSLIHVTPGRLPPGFISSVESTMEQFKKSLTGHIRQQFDTEILFIFPLAPKVEVPHWVRGKVTTLEVDSSPLCQICQGAMLRQSTKTVYGFQDVEILPTVLDSFFQISQHSERFKRLLSLI